MGIILTFTRVLRSTGGYSGQFNSPSQGNRDNITLTFTSLEQSTALIGERTHPLFVKSKILTLSDFLAFKMV